MKPTIAKHLGLLIVVRLISFDHSHLVFLCNPPPFFLLLPLPATATSNRDKARAAKGAHWLRLSVPLKRFTQHYLNYFTLKKDII
jgi:hypothetical protein